MNGLVKFPNFLLHYMFQLACDIFLSHWGSLSIWQLPKPWRKTKVFHHSFCSHSVQPLPDTGSKSDAILLVRLLRHTKKTEETYPKKKEVVLLEHNSRVFLTGQNEDNRRCERGCCKEGSRTLIWCHISVSQELEQQFTISIPWLPDYLQTSVTSGLAQTVCRAVPAIL